MCSTWRVGLPVVVNLARKSTHPDPPSVSALKRHFINVGVPGVVNPAVNSARANPPKVRAFERRVMRV